MSKILAVDVGFASSGLAVLEADGHGGWRLGRHEYVATEKSDKKHGVRVADDDLRRVQQMARRIIDVINEEGLNRMVVEVPHGGGQSSRAVRAMALASAMVATIAEGLSIAAEWYTPNDTRMAATGSGKASKDEVVAAIGARYPAVHKLKTKPEREAVADALATFEAAKSGNLVRTCAHN